MAGGDGEAGGGGSVAAMIPEDRTWDDVNRMYDSPVEARYFGPSDFPTVLPNDDFSRYSDREITAWSGGVSCSVIRSYATIISGSAY